MRGVVAVGVVPHPPILVPEIGGERLDAIAATRSAMTTLAAEVAGVEPRTVVIISPHGEVDPRAITLAGSPRLEGDFAAFGRSDLAFSCDNDLMLARATERLAEQAGVPVRLREGRGFARPGPLPYAFLVPWYYLVQAGVRARVMEVTMGHLAPGALYRFGRLLAEAGAQTATRTAILASGDLSHRLTRDAPAGFHPDGDVFDRAIIDALGDGRPAGVLGIEPGLADRAGECGWRPIIMALGALQGQSFRSRVLSYEGPFGVGYGVALLTPAPDLPGLARRALATYLREGRVVEPAEDFGGPAGVFVTITLDGKLRGCMGTAEPVAADRAREVVANAIRAGTADPRFPPVRLEDVEGLDFKVDVLGSLEPVQDLADLDPGQYGLVVSRGASSALLLPALKGIETAEEQLRAALEKAGLSDRAGVRMYRFTSTRYHSPAGG